MYSTIIPWRDRTELCLALPALVAEATSSGGEVIVVNYGGSAERLESQLENFRNRVIVVQVEQNGYFNKPRAHNIGAFHATHDIFFFCDCDILIESGVVLSLVRKLAEELGIFCTLAGVRETEQNSRNAKHIACFGYELILRTVTNRQIRIVDNEEDAATGTRQAPGLLLVRRTDFERVNGYNSQLDGWGWEDQDMICRLTLGGGLTRVSEGYVLHISHDDHARVQAYPIADRWESRDRMFRRALANYDNANFVGTYQSDIAAGPVSKDA